MAPSIAVATSGTETEGVRRRSLSGASALLARRFTRQSSAPRPTASRSESTARRRATIASTQLTQEQLDDIKVHVRIVPNIENPSRSLIFDIVDREMNVGSVIRIGRYSERHANLNCMSFKSKVVSRCHCEVWVETDGKLYIRDTKSSSGTFLNHVRLSPAGNESRPVELSDGDIVQLGVDFQGGREEMYRSVKMRFELNRSSGTRPLSYNLNAFQNLRNFTQHNNTTAPVTPPLPTIENTDDIQSSENNEAQPIDVPHQKTCSTVVNNIPTSSPALHNHDNELDECCICLYALAPFQALFVSPCSHTYHFKCIRPLLLSYPGFQCPICRTYSDLEASVAIETDEVMEKYDINNRSTVVATVDTADAPPTDSGLGLQSSSIGQTSEEARVLDDDNQPLSNIEIPTNIPPLSATTGFVSSPVIYSEITPDPLLVTDHTTTNLPNETDQVIIEDSSLSNDDSMVEDNGVTTNTDDDDDLPAHSRPRERRTSHIMDKIKMVFFEKRKSASTTAGNNHYKNRRSNRSRPLSYPNLIDDENAAATNEGSSHASSPPLEHTLSRQSTTHLAEIDEEEERSRTCIQAMVVDG
ncbi:unnamed protein product [Mucor hiemalis]